MLSGTVSETTILSFSVNVTRQDLDSVPQLSIHTETGFLLHELGQFVSVDLMDIPIEYTSFIIAMTSSQPSTTPP